MTNSSSKSPSKYVLVMHSGLGATAVEHTSATTSQAAEVERAGGVVCDDWGAGDELADAALRYGGGIAPIGVRGTFHPTLSVHGLPVLIPDEFLRTFAALLRERRGHTSVRELRQVAEAIAEQRLPEQGPPARCDLVTSHR
jgi:hypothetical protein